MKNILILKLSSLGDVIHTLPAAQALRRAYPAARLAWAVDRAHATIPSRQTWLDEVIEHDRKDFRTFVDFIRRLRRTPWDAVIDFQGLFRSALVARLSGAKRRIGQRPSRELAHWFYNEPVAVSTDSQHAVDRYYALAAHAGGSLPGMPLLRSYLDVAPRIEGPANPASAAAVSSASLFPLCPNEAERRETDAWLDVQGFSAPHHRLVVLHPHARRSANRWPPASFAALAKKLAALDDVRVALVGGGAARDLCDGIADASGLGSRLWRADGQLSLLASAELFSRAAVMVTNDTGPMHIAAAMGTPLVALCGATNPLRTGPYCDNAIVIDKRLPCGHCKAKTCPRHLDPPECMTRITVDEVVAAVRRQLAVSDAPLRRSA